MGARAARSADYEPEGVGDVRGFTGNGGAGFGGAGGAAGEGAGDETCGGESFDCSKALPRNILYGNIFPNMTNLVDVQSGIDIFYIDESCDKDFYAMTAIAIPFVRFTESGCQIVWNHYFESAQRLRKDMRLRYDLSTQKELKGSLLLSGHGNYKIRNQGFTKAQAVQIYKDLLSGLSFLPASSVISVVGTASTQLYGYKSLLAVLYALLQRMRRTCRTCQRVGMVFFDEGHNEYRKLYRQSQKYLPTGSNLGTWETGRRIKNLHLDNFVKDGNIKDSKQSSFIQFADLVSFAALLETRSKMDVLTQWQKQIQAGDLYLQIPSSVLN
ncbi:MAG: DUF3800 domain-containing protein, partial [Thermaceae bacterium]|nr:DUF3800 domain-containing protein [Thermaceae bacterium]